MFSKFPVFADNHLIFSKPLVDIVGEGDAETEGLLVGKLVLGPSVGSDIRELGVGGVGTSSARLFNELSLLDFTCQGKTKQNKTKQTNKIINILHIEKNKTIGCVYPLNQSH